VKKRRNGKKRGGGRREREPRPQPFILRPFCKNRFGEPCAFAFAKERKKKKRGEERWKAKGENGLLHRQCAKPCCPNLPEAESRREEKKRGGGKEGKQGGEKSLKDRWYAIDARKRKMDLSKKKKKKKERRRERGRKETREKQF